METQRATAFGAYGTSRAMGVAPSQAMTERLNIEPGGAHQDLLHVLRLRYWVWRNPPQRS